MEECTGLTAYRPTFDPETVAKLAEAIARIYDAIAEAVKRMAEAFQPVVKAAVDWISGSYGSMLRSVATPKEWYLMNHARRWRTRKKYRNRLARRLLSIMAEGGDNDD